MEKQSVAMRVVPILPRKEDFVADMEGERGSGVARKDALTRQ